MMGPLKPKEPSWWNSVRNSDLSNTSDEQMEIWRADFKIFEEKYREYAAERSKLHSEIVDLARDLWGLGSKQVMYIQREKPVSHLVWGFDIIERKRRDDIKAKADAEKQKELDISKDKLVAEAILWLQGKGKTLGEDFTPANAVCIADDISFDEEVNRLTASGGYIDFSGDDNCEDCEGWDMSSHRCYCGNRRVSWVTGWGHSFKSPSIYAEAH